jgi:hypothetical protein
MAFSSLMRRLGYVKLDAYGLVLTSEGRVLSNRPVLDDGLGQKIVGWQEGDLAAMELEHWQPRGAIKPLAKPTVRTPVAMAPTVPQPAMPAPPPIPQRPLPGMTYMTRPMADPMGPSTPDPKLKRAPTPLPLETMPVARVADPMQVGEDGDEWEWEIAVARARAAAEWAQEAADAAATHLRMPAPLPPAPKQRATSPIAIVAAPKISDHTEPLAKMDWDTTTTAPPVRVLPHTKAATPVKPIVIAERPQIPSVSPRAPLQPIVSSRNQRHVEAAPPRRFPRATPATTPDAMLEIGDDTHTQVSISAVDDATRPGLLMPTVTSGTSKRAAAKQR